MLFSSYESYSVHEIFHTGSITYFFNVLESFIASKSLSQPPKKQNKTFQDSIEGTYLCKWVRVKNKAGEDSLRKIHCTLLNKNCITLEAGKEANLWQI